MTVKPATDALGQVIYAARQDLRRLQEQLEEAEKKASQADHLVFTRRAALAAGEKRLLGLERGLNLLLAGEDAYASQPASGAADVIVATGA